MMSLGILLTVALVLGLFAMYFMYITSPKQSGARKTRDRVDLSIVPGKWSEIQAMMGQGGPANYKQSIMEADKLVDNVLGSKVSGNTMGERLKNAKHLFSPATYDGLWTAHKIRNKIAHEADFEGLSSDATLAVRNFERALKELRAI
jgi:hypothetical protein